jgi:integrase
MSGKRGRDEGNIRKRTNGLWEGRFYVDNGQRKSVYGKTRQEVRDKLAASLKDKKDGIPFVGEGQTVKQYLESWLDTVRYQVKPSTWRRYQDFTRHIIAALGRIPLTKVTAQQIQGFYAQKLKDGLSTTTVHHIHGMFHRACADALRMAIVQRNVTEMVRPPRRQHHEIEPLSEKQAQALLLAVAGDRFEALYVLALTTGMRLGELLGLRWRDVDINRAKLQIRLSVQEDGYKFVLAEPKTANSRRTIGLSRLAIHALREHRARQSQEKAKLGPAWDDALELVFPNAIGGIMIPDNLTKRSFKQFLDKAGLPNIRFHDLRHTAATLLLSQKVNVKVVSEMIKSGKCCTLPKMAGR